MTARDVLIKARSEGVIILPKWDAVEVSGETPSIELLRLMREHKRGLVREILQEQYTTLTHRGWLMKDEIDAKNPQDPADEVRFTIILKRIERVSSLARHYGVKVTPAPNPKNHRPMEVTS